MQASVENSLTKTRLSAVILVGVFVDSHCISLFMVNCFYTDAQKVLLCVKGRLSEDLELRFTITSQRAIVGPSSRISGLFNAR